MSDTSIFDPSQNNESQENNPAEPSEVTASVPDGAGGEMKVTATKNGVKITAPPAKGGNNAALGDNRPKGIAESFVGLPMGILICGPVDLSRRLTHWQAKLALKQFIELDGTAKLRVLRASKLITRLDLPPIPKGSAPLRVPVLVDHRDLLLKRLARHQFHFDDIWYDLPVSPKRYYKRLDFPERDCPLSVSTSARLINIPTHLPPERLQKALTIIKEYL